MSNEEQVKDYGPLVSNSFPFKYGGVEYSLIGAPSGVVAEYKDKITSGIQFNKDGSKQLGPIESAKFFLLSKSVLNAKGQTIGTTALQAWGPEVIDDLFARAKRFCGINDDTMKLKRIRVRQAFEEPGAPCTFEEFAEWVNNSADEELVAPLADLFVEDLESEGKD